MDLAFDDMYGRLGRGRILNLLGVQLYYNAESVFLGVHASLRWLHNANCLFLSFLLITSEFKGSDQRENRLVWRYINTRYLVWGCGDGRSFVF
jgi:hypothetical protein